MPFAITGPPLLRPDVTKRAEFLESLQQRIRLWNAELAPDAPTFQAAVLLLAALRVGQNTAKLSRFTRYSQSFVAKCARRLCDNGVWNNGETVRSWSGGWVSEPAFWNDVSVAEGRMCRRIDKHGNPEWAPAGRWVKFYDYSPRCESAEQANRYVVSASPNSLQGAPPLYPLQDAAVNVANSERADSGGIYTPSSTRSDRLNPASLKLFPNAEWLT